MQQHLVTWRRLCAASEVTSAAAWRHADGFRPPASIGGAAGKEIASAKHDNNKRNYITPTKRRHLRILYENRAASGLQQQIVLLLLLLHVVTHSLTDQSLTNHWPTAWLTSDHCSVLSVKTRRLELLLLQLPLASFRPLILARPISPIRMIGGNI